MKATRKELARARTIARNHDKPVYVYSGALNSTLTLMAISGRRGLSAIVYPSGAVDR